MSNNDVDGAFEESQQMLHVHDLPQLYTKPSYNSLLAALNILEKAPSSFENVESSLFDGKERPRNVSVDPTGVPRYLTNIVSSDLTWLREDDREIIWENASMRLSERSGRVAAPSMSRNFKIASNLTFSLYEPSITEDSLGLKTWTSSLLLSRRLRTMTKFVPPDHPKLLELGSGTGLVGMAAAVVWQELLSAVHLTDLPEIVPNLQRNIQQNAQLFRKGPSTNADPQLCCRVLDWADESDRPDNEKQRFPLIIAADPIYSTEHPRLLADTIQRWLERSARSRFIVELPLRDSFRSEIADLQQRLQGFMSIIDEGKEVGFDDWELADGRPAEVECWWSVWRPHT